MCRYLSMRDDQAPQRMRLKELAATSVRFGYRRLHVRLRPEGWGINSNRGYRLYRAEQLILRTRALRLSATRINDSWAMDYVTDELFDGRRIRLLAIVDPLTRESLTLEVEPRFRGQGFALASQRIGGCPRRFQVDDGPGVTS